MKYEIREIASFPIEINIYYLLFSRRIILQSDGTRRVIKYCKNSQNKWYMLI